MRIWPAIDIRGGKCVRLAQGDYQQETIYGDNPADMAHRWIAEGATGLHIVDLDGARDGLNPDGSSPNREALARITREVSVDLQIGGGIREESTIEDYLEMGINRLVIGTRALTDPEWSTRMIEKFPGHLIIGIDARQGRVATNGWLKTSETTAIQHAKHFSEQAIAGIIYTDISKDGMLKGPNLVGMKEMAEAVSSPIIASGGVTTASDIVELAQMNLSGAIIGRTLYEGFLTLTDALEAAQAPV
ncbi:MAG: 1-(5-phosphoribosyl)-5-[(5-phosphoribosylamino)methylideneamino]imidazole-4-carboxamide isomerase [Mariniblastus sp.]|nr:1-(5-phosphoribosyl)-5-[(5-phosphoribosylamino)methylideneamino]imidazole-4-carboxamide isomerase [Mariniblastus sp.]